jgi:hypothetical protein
MRARWLFGHVAQVEAPLGPLERDVGDLDADDAGELFVLEEAGEQLALAAAEVEDGADLGGAQELDDGVEALVVEVHGALEGLLGEVAGEQLGLLVGEGDGLGLGLGEAGEGGAGEAGAVLEVAGGDGLAFGVVGEPAVAEAEELVDLLVADVVVLVVVEDGEEDVEVGEELAQGAAAGELDGPVGGHAPAGVGGVAGIEGMRSQATV